MSRLVKIFALLVSLVIVPTAVAAATKVAGTWERIPSAPSGTLPAATVWTGRQLIVLGRRVGSGALAQAYDPTAKAWKRLTPPAKLGSDPYCCSAVWTGKQLLAWGAFAAAAYDPATNSWRTLSRSIQGGILVWTGREAIGWGGGCCGDARSNGRTYNPATKTFRALPRSPLAPDQGPVGAWTGRELLLFVRGLTPDGKPYPSSARARVRARLSRSIRRRIVGGDSLRRRRPPRGLSSGRGSAFSSGRRRAGSATTRRRTGGPRCRAGRCARAQVRQSRGPGVH